MQPGDGRTERVDTAEALARGAVEWMITRAEAADPDLSLHHGWSGVLLALVEAEAHFGDPHHAAAAERVADLVAGRVDQLDDSSLYCGAAGVAGAMRAVGRDDAADRALELVRSRFDGERWNPMSELFAGNAGIGLGAWWAADVELAVTAVTPYLTSADRTVGGVNWAVRPLPARSHHVAHGTLGIVCALATIGDAAGRTDMVELALDGAADVVSRNVAGPEGFLVPHSDPPHRPDLIERYSYGWCNGPAGDAQVFRVLARITADPTWDDLADACWRTVTTSGLPARRRPGFWDNHGRCCGTAGVLALACDRIVERTDDDAFGDVLVDDLIARDRRRGRCPLVERRTPVDTCGPATGTRMGHGQRRHRPRTVALGAGAPWCRRRVRGAVARPSRGRRRGPGPALAPERASTLACRRCGSAAGRSVLPPRREGHA